MTAYSDTARLLDEVQEAHKRLMHARLGLRRSVKEEAAANTAYADAVNALLPVEPVAAVRVPGVFTWPPAAVPNIDPLLQNPLLHKPVLVGTTSAATTYTSSDLAQVHRPWKHLHGPLDGNNAG